MTWCALAEVLFAQAQLMTFGILTKMLQSLEMLNLLLYKEMSFLCNWSNQWDSEEGIYIHYILCTYFFSKYCLPKSWVFLFTSVANYIFRYKKVVIFKVWSNGILLCIAVIISHHITFHDTNNITFFSHVLWQSFESLSCLSFLFSLSTAWRSSHSDEL